MFAGLFGLLVSFCCGRGWETARPPAWARYCGGRPWLRSERPLNVPGEGGAFYGKVPPDKEG
jgi:hypothetical protein